MKSTSSIALALLLTSLLVGCARDIELAAQPDVGRDAGPGGKSDSPDTSATPDTSELEGDQGVEQPLEPTWTRFTLADGLMVEGEVIATYDRALWWNAAPGELFAVFDPLKFAPYPGDRSLRFVGAEEIVSREIVTPSPARPSYREFLRNGWMHFQRPPLEGASFVITGNESYHLEEDGYGDFAWDVEKTDDEGRWFSGAGSQNEDYFVWDEPVLSGVAGEVIDVVDDGVDNVPGSHPDRAEAVNNLVGIALGGHFYAYYLHFRQHGVDPAIEVGSQVNVGDVLGRVGNSGVTLEPHIHVVMLWFDVEAQRSYSVPAEFSDVEVSANARGPYLLQDWWVPATGEWLKHP